MPIIAVHALTGIHYYPGSPSKKLSISDRSLPEPTVKQLGEGLSIIFEDFQFPYSTGDVVRGHVQLHCPRQRIIGAIQLDFICQARTRGRIWGGDYEVESGEKVYESRCGYMTYWTQHLQFTEAPETFAAGTYKWPFLVEIPFTCTRLQEPNMFDEKGFANWKKYSLKSRRGNQEHLSCTPFAIPGTFCHSLGKDSASIEYVAIARAYDCAGPVLDASSKTIVTLCPIYVRQKHPSRPISAAVSSGMFRQRMQIPMKKKGESSIMFNLRKKYSRFFTISSFAQNCMALDLSFTFPPYLDLPNAQTPLPLTLRVNYPANLFEGRTETSHMPHLHLVWAEVAVRIRNTWRPDADEATISDVRITISNPAQQLLELEVIWQSEKRERFWEVDLGRLLNLSIIPSEVWSAGVFSQILPFTFETPAISRQYILEFKLCFRTEDAGETLFTSQWSDDSTPWIIFSPNIHDARSPDGMTLASEPVGDESLINMFFGAEKEHEEG